MEVDLRLLQERVKTLESEPAVAAQLCQRAKELEGQLAHAAHTQSAVRQGAIQWHKRVEAEQAARQKAEGQTSTVRQENQRIHAESEKWQQKAAKAYPVLKSLDAEVEQLKPLKVRVCHPYTFCKEPMSGSVDRETAARLMRDSPASLASKSNALTWGDGSWQVALPSTGRRSCGGTPNLQDSSRRMTYDLSQRLFVLSGLAPTAG